MPRSLLHRLAAIGLFLLLAPPLPAQPSYPCDGRLNAAERTICRDRTLARLDVTMARLYEMTRRAGVDGAPERFAAKQRTWRAHRDDCGRDAACLERRYVARITDFRAVLGGRAGDLGADVVASAPAADQVVARRVRNGRVERVYADGTIRWKSLSGGAQGVIYPDGTEQVQMYSQSTPPSFPGLPSAYDGWGQAVEARLRGIVLSMLAQTDQQTYSALADARPFSDRVLRHVDAITFLLTE